MPRRRKNSADIGGRLRKARQDVGHTVARVAEETGINASSLSRFENNHSTPSFEDVCNLAQFYGWPLYFFATGRERAGDDPRDLAAHLFYWGLRDLQTSGKRPLIGEVKAFESAVAEAADEASDARIVEALPALLLLNDFQPSRLLSAARSHGTVPDVGWLSQVAYIVSRRLDVNSIRPGAARRVDSTWREARGELLRQGPLEKATGGVEGLAKRWGIDRLISVEEFETRARSILDAAT